MKQFDILKLLTRMFEIHDVDVNQKYGWDLPYSFHLKAVLAQGTKFKHLLTYDEWLIVQAALGGHDLIEDARMTYNDVIELCRIYMTKAMAKKVADIVYLVTDFKGKNRAKRKPVKYYRELKSNRLAVFVKLSDLAANKLYSRLTNSSMYEKYKKEFPKFKELVYVEDYGLKEMFDYVESI